VLLERVARLEVARLGTEITSSISDLTVDDFVLRKLPISNKSPQLSTSSPQRFQYQSAINNQFQQFSRVRLKRLFLVLFTN
jgi:hypothetical protein